MRILLALFTVLLLVSCKKEDAPESFNSLMGSWDWVGTSGGWSGGNGEQASEEHTQRLEFIDNTHFVWWENGIVIHQGNYTLEQGYAWILGETEWLLTLDGFLGSAFIVTQTDNSLLLRQNAADGFTYAFEK